MSFVCRRKSMAGFTLVEMSIVLIISGMVMLMIAAFAKNYYHKVQEQRTLDNMHMAEIALVQFVGNTGRYPCPADPTLTPDEAGYGLEACRAAPLPKNCNGNPPGLACTRWNSRDTDGDTVPEVVMMGMLPVKTIENTVSTDVNFRGHDGLDGYGNRLTYAVTEIMTSQANNASNPVSYDQGSIRVQDRTGLNLTSPAATAHFVLVSHGENGEGAYSQGGEIVPDCTVIIAGVPSPAPPGAFGGVNPEKENCDRNDAMFVDDVRSLNWGGNTYFDDIVVFRAGGFQPLWLPSLSSPAGSTYIYNTNMGDVAIGPGLTEPAQKLHVSGDASVEGAVLAQGYCDVSGPNTDGATGDPSLDNCMSASTIGGKETDMKCSNLTDAAYGIADNKILCAPLFVNPPDPSKVCPAGQYLVGISNKGNIRCAPL